MPCTLRPVTLPDIEIAAGWVSTQTEFERWTGMAEGFLVDTKDLADKLGCTSANSFVLTDGLSLFAFGQLHRKEPSRGHLARLIVAPPFRGRGHGEALVIQLIEKARMERFERASLHVNVHNDVAIGLYTKLGFCDAMRPGVEPLPHSRYMEKDLMD